MGSHQQHRQESAGSSPRQPNSGTVHPGHLAMPLMGTPGAVFQQDNARPHTARITVAYFNNQNIRTLPWPSLSPDISPIEHLWDELDRRLRVRNVPPTAPDELFAALQEDWETIPKQTMQHMIASMPRRCRAVIQANGGHTRY